MVAARHIILFDGTCNFCSRWVHFIIRHDNEGKIHFAAMQSDAGKKILNEHNLSHLVNSMDTFIFIDHGKIYSRSSAGLRIAKYLDGGWKFFSVFLIVPPFLRDAVYNFIAKNRYKWWGKRKECMVPNEDVKKRFIYDE